MSTDHPDLHELHDWPMYGPKNARIADLVWELALEHGLRVKEIEAIIEAALDARVRQMKGAAGRGPASDP